MLRISCGSGKCKGQEFDPYSVRRVVASIAVIAGNGSIKQHIALPSRCLLPIECWVFVEPADRS
jgi:hypothetical protein